MKNLWKLSLRPSTPLRLPSSNRCSKPQEFPSSRAVKISTTHFAEHFAARYSILVDGLSFSSFPSALREKRGCCFKKERLRMRNRDHSRPRKKASIASARALVASPCPHLSLLASRET